jgi:hypothetical protein
MLSPLAAQLGPLGRAVAVPRTYEAVVLADSPVAFWRLGEPSGTQAADSSGNGLHGTYSAVTLGTDGALTGDTDKAITLAGGSPSYVDCGSPAALDIVGQLTLEGWVYPVGGTLSAWVDHAQEGTSIENYAVLMSGTTLYFQWFSGSFQALVVNGVYVTNVWQHLVVTYNAGVVTAYKNGSQVGTASGQPAMVANAANTCKLGRYQVGSQGWFPGRLDEVAIYATDIGADRVLAHYNAGIGA